MTATTASKQAPDWANRITCDLPLASVGSTAPEAIQAELRRFANQALALVWRRLSKATREWLTAWWAS